MSTKILAGAGRLVLDASLLAQGGIRALSSGARGLTTVDLARDLHEAIAYMRKWHSELDILPVETDGRDRDGVWLAA